MQEYRLLVNEGKLIKTEKYTRIFCMCIAAPGKVVSIVSKMVKVSYPGGIENKAMIADVVPKVGDNVLVQMGVVLRILSKEEADASKRAWSETTS